MPERTDRLALIDLETTGTSPATDRITEIGLVLMDAGEVTQCWSSLVNPGQPVAPEIQWLTGLSNEQLARAPVFSEVWPHLAPLLHQRILVAHNARFDHGFLKAEWRRLGERHFTEVLCTARLSRRLFSHVQGHGLDAISLRHGLEPRAAGLARTHAADCTRTQRHSALGDALRLAAFVQTLNDSLPAPHLQTAILALLRRPACPPNLDASILESLPEEPGVYVFRGESGQPLYVGKARNLSERIRGHFHADSRLAIDARLSNETHAIETQVTADEFAALVLEAQWVKGLAPLHNRQLRSRPGVRFIHLPDPNGAPRLLSLGDLLKLGPSPSSWPPDLFGPFPSAAAARSALGHLGRVHCLCDAGIGLWHRGREGAPAPCFSRQIGRCLGLCTGDESVPSHHARLQAALQALRLPPWPCDGPWVYRASTRDGRLAQLLQFEDWCALGGSPNQRLAFDPDVYRMLRRHMTRLEEMNPASATGVATDAGPRQSSQP